MLYSNYLRQLDLQDIAIFLNLLDLRSAKRTAELMSISQPTVSYCLKRLRGCFDDVLFTSSQGALVPTIKAEKIAPYLHIVVDSINRCAKEETGAPIAPITRIWQICAPEYFELYLLPHILQPLQEKYINVLVNLERLGADLPIERLIAGEVDITIGFGPGYHRLHPELEWQPILDDQFLCLTSYLGQAPEKNMALDDFCTSPHVFPTPWPSAKNMVDSWLEKVGRSRKILVKANGYQACINIIATVPATLALPSKLLHSLHIPENVIVCKPPMGFPSFTLDMIWSKERNRNQDITGLKNMIKEASHRC